MYIRCSKVPHACMARRELARKPWWWNQGLTEHLGWQPSGQSTWAKYRVRVIHARFTHYPCIFYPESFGSCLPKHQLLWDFRVLPFTSYAYPDTVSIIMLPNWRDSEQGQSMNYLELHWLFCQKSPVHEHCLYMQSNTPNRDLMLVNNQAI